MFLGEHVMKRSVLLLSLFLLSIVHVPKIMPMPQKQSNQAASTNQIASYSRYLMAYLLLQGVSTESALVLQTLMPKIIKTLKNTDTLEAVGVILASSLTFSGYGYKGPLIGFTLYLLKKGVQYGTIQDIVAAALKRMTTTEVTLTTIVACISFIALLSQHSDLIPHLGKILILAACYFTLYKMKDTALMKVFINGIRPITAFMEPVTTSVLDFLTLNSKTAAQLKKYNNFMTGIDYW